MSLRIGDHPNPMREALSHWSCDPGVIGKQVSVTAVTGSFLRGRLQADFWLYAGNFRKLLVHLGRNGMDEFLIHHLCFLRKEGISGA